MDKITSPILARLNSLRDSKAYRNNIQLLSLIILTAVGLTSLLIALPQTEQYLNGTRFDINDKADSYRSRSYTLQFDIKTEDRSVKRQKVQKSLDIIHKRLSDFGVEEVRIHSSDPIGDLENEGLSVDLTDFKRITVTTTQDERSVDRLINQRGYVRIVTPKEGVDFADPENPIAQYLPESYENSEFTIHDFRAIPVKELSTSSGGTAFFSLYKPKLQQSRAFTSFLEEYAGETVGIQIDGLVNPYQVPLEYAAPSTHNGIATGSPEFAPGISSNAEDAEISEIILNGDVIPLQYSVVDSSGRSFSSDELSSNRAYAALAMAFISILAFIGWRNAQDREELSRYILATTVSFTLWISILKIFEIPVDLEIIAISSIFLLIFSKVLLFRNHEGSTPMEVLLGSVSILLVLFGDGYLKLFGEQLILITVVTATVHILSAYYIANLSPLLEND